MWFCFVAGSEDHFVSLLNARCCFGNLNSRLPKRTRLDMFCVVFYCRSRLSQRACNRRLESRIYLEMKKQRFSLRCFIYSSKETKCVTTEYKHIERINDKEESSGLKSFRRAEQGEDNHRKWISGLYLSWDFENKVYCHERVANRVCCFACCCVWAQARRKPPRPRPRPLSPRALASPPQATRNRVNRFFFLKLCFC